MHISVGVPGAASAAYRKEVAGRAATLTAVDG